MSLIYYNAVVDNTWDNPLNWWTDSSYTIPYGFNPQSGDTCYIDEYIIAATSGPYDMFTIVCGSINSSAFSVDFSPSLTFSNLAFEQNCYSVATIPSTIGSINFYNSSSNQGTVNANPNFLDSSYNSGTVNNSLTEFHNSSYNTGIINGDAYFHDTSSMQGGSVTGIAQFGTPSGSDNSWYGAGSISGIVIFYSNSYIINGATFAYNTTLYDQSVNNGAITGDVIFYNLSSNGGTGTINGACTFHNTSSNYGSISSGIFYNTSFNNGLITTASPVSEFHDISYNAPGGSFSDGDFYDTSHNEGVCTSIATFKNIGTAQLGYALSYSLPANSVASTDGTAGTDGVGNYSAKFTVVKAAVDILGTGLL